MGLGRAASWIVTVSHKIYYVNDTQESQVFYLLDFRTTAPQFAAVRVSARCGAKLYALDPARPSLATSDQARLDAGDGREAGL